MRLFPDRKSQAVLRALRKKLGEAQAKASPQLAQMLVLQDAELILEPRIFTRGNAGRPANFVTRQYLQFFAGESAKPYRNGSGRLELAEAIVADDNPLTTRVIVNRVWQHHFGVGLVSTPSDFGLQGAPPSHPLLLDHLASWFQQHGWSLKALHRYIMQSATYQQQSQANATADKIDPANRLCWKMNRRRLDFETLRDALLSVSGQLDLTVGGKPAGLPTAIANKRRTLYSYIDRQQLPSLFRTFDFPSPDVSSGERTVTSVPGQTLFLMNHPLVLSAARKLGAEAKSKPDGIAYLYHQILKRPPLPAENKQMQTYLQADRLQQVESKNSRNTEWSYGYGRLDVKSNQLSGFTKLSYVKEGQYQGGEQLPDAKIGWVFLNATGGHPGNNLEHVAVIRWIAPANMTVSLNGTLKHGLKQGNGIRGRILGNGKPLAGPWVLHNKSVATTLKHVAIKQGETIDFVVDINNALGFDSFTWSPEIVIESTTVKLKRDHWTYTKDFQTLPPEPVSPWQNMAHVLLLSNEFQFID